MQKDFVQTISQPAKQQDEGGFGDTSSEDRMKAEQYQTGISKETLQAIEQKNRLVQEAKEQNRRLMESQESQKNQETLFKLANQLMQLQ